MGQIIILSKINGIVSALYCCIVGLGTLEMGISQELSVIVKRMHYRYVVGEMTELIISIAPTYTYFLRLRP